MWGCDGLYGREKAEGIAMGHVALDQYRALETELASFCERWKVAELSESDDLYLTARQPGAMVVIAAYRPDEQWSLMDHVIMEEELSGVLGRPVFLISRRGLVQSGEPSHVAKVLNGAQPLYVAG
jgi:uncharacterized protein